MENNGRENMEVGATQEDGACNIANSKSLVVKLPLFQLSRTPSSSPTNQIRTLGMSKEVAVQADRGMIVDKDVRNRLSSLSRSKWCHPLYPTGSRCLPSCETA